MYIINALIYDPRTYIGTYILCVRYVSIVILLYEPAREGKGRDLESVQCSFGGMKKKRKPRREGRGGIKKGTKKRGIKLVGVRWDERHVAGAQVCARAHFNRCVITCLRHCSRRTPTPLAERAAAVLVTLLLFSFFSSLSSSLLFFRAPDHDGPPAPS